MGKTQRLLEWAASQPEGTAHIIVSPNANTSMNLLKRSRDQGLNLASWQFVCVDEVRRKTAGFMAGVRITRPDIKFSIDNADWILHDLIGAPISIITITESETQKPCDTCGGSGTKTFNTTIGPDVFYTGPCPNPNCSAAMK